MSKLPVATISAALVFFHLLRAECDCLRHLCVCVCCWQMSAKSASAHTSPKKLCVCASFLFSLVLGSCERGYNGAADLQRVFSASHTKTAQSANNIIIFAKCTITVRSRSKQWSIFHAI
jgi:hypothetical protein